MVSATEEQGGVDHDAARPARAAGIAAAVTAVVLCALALNFIYNLRLFVGYTIILNQFYYLCVFFSLPMVFVIWPLRGKRRAGWEVGLDTVLCLLTFGCMAFMVWNARRVSSEGWEYVAPEPAIWVSILLWVLVLEALRRVGGTVITVIAAVISIYPLVAGVMPGPISAASVSVRDTAIFYVMSTESVFGIPLAAFATLVIGYIIFGVALQQTGGGPFFINLAFALLGTVRGGPAKVAIFSSGLMGSISGSVITNVLTTGTMTIPTMKRTGFAPHYAGGIEACASTGAVLMPPVMGATAFLIAQFLGVGYADVVFAAIVPSFLYFLALFVQIDAYAARNGLKGLPRVELPRLGKVLAEGWYYLIAMGVLIYMIVYLQREATAPFIATAFVLILNQVFPHNRWGLAEAMGFLRAVGRLFAELVAILCGIGLIVGALAVTGMSGTIANDLLHLAGGSTLMLLIMGAVACFVLGMGMTVTAAYIFLAIALVPALARAGLDPMAAHLFVLYWSMLSYITPPVALAAFSASAIAKANPMRTGFAAMRLGSVIYVVPFFFVLEPALILRGDTATILFRLAEAAVGVTLIAGALDGHVLGVGHVDRRHHGIGVLARVLVVVGGLLIAAPLVAILGIDRATGLMLGVVPTIAGLALIRVFRDRASPAAQTA